VKRSDYIILINMSLFHRSCRIVLGTLLLFGIAGCGSDRAKIENAKFEIEQGNRENARRLLKTIPHRSPDKESADSLLRLLEGPK